jgi:hypothetical protein
VPVQVVVDGSKASVGQSCPLPCNFG